MNIEHYLNLEMKQLENSNNYKSVIAIRNNLLTKYDIEIDSSSLSKKLKGNVLLFEIKNNLFVSRSKFDELIQNFKNKDDLKNNLFNLYFLEFSEEEIKRFINHTEIISKDPILEIKQIDEFEILSLYIALRSQKYFILKYMNCFDKKYSNFLFFNQLYLNNKITEIGEKKAKNLENILVPKIFKRIEFVKLVTNKDLSFNDLSKVLKTKLSIKESQNILLDLNLIKNNPKIENIDTINISTDNNRIKSIDIHLDKKDNETEIFFKKIINLNYLYECLNANYNVLDETNLKKVIEQLLLTKPLKTEEIQFNLNILFNINISLDEINKILLDFTTFKRINAFKYSVSNSKHRVFSGNFKEDLDFILENLKEKEKKVFQYRIIENLTLEEIGKKINLTRERVRQLEKKINIKLQTLIFLNIFNPYFSVIKKLFKEQNIWKIELLELEIKKYFILKKTDLNILLKLYLFLKNIKLIRHYSDFIGTINKKDIFSLFNYTINIPLTYDEFISQLKKKNIKNLEFIEKFLEKENYILRSGDFILIKDRKIGIADKIRLLFYISQRELKFNEIQQLFFKYYDQNITIGNISTKLELYKDIFVRTYIGTYSLCEWGSNKHISSRDLIKNYFKTLEKPVKIEEIIDSIIKKCRVSEGTVKVFVGEDKDVFSYSHGEWALKRWKDDPIKSKKYKINQYRIEASLNNLINTNHKGFFKRKDQLVSLHCAGKSYLKENGYINIGKKIEKFITSKSITLEYKQKEYNLSISNFVIYKINKVLTEIGILNGDYFYLVYSKKNTIQLFKWDEFENMSDKLFIENLNTIEITEKPVQEFPNEVVKNIPVTFQNLLEKGLKDGKVTYSDIEKINYNLENKIFNMYEAIDELINSGIMIS